jgi:hypothetical protein
MKWGVLNCLSFSINVDMLLNIVGANGPIPKLCWEGGCSLVIYVYSSSTCAHLFVCVCVGARAYACLLGS